MKVLLAKLRLWWTALRKARNAFVDAFNTGGYVEAWLIYANGPKKGQVAKVIKGRNIVTGWLGVGAFTSGRDMMRRLLIPNSSSASGGFAGELSSNDDATIQAIVLGSGSTAETSNDGDPTLGWTDAVETVILEKTITDVVLDGSNPYVTFVTEFDETEANQSISEAGLKSGRGDRVARKTFDPFTKTSDFTLQVRWTMRF